VKVRISVVALALAAVSGRAAEAQSPGPPPLNPATRGAVVDSVRNALLKYYVLPDAGKTMATHLDERRRARAFDTLINPNALAAAITRALRQAHADAHLRIVFDPAEAARAADTTRLEARETLGRDRRANFYFHEARILAGNTGYLEFTRFADTSVDARNTVRAAMRFVANADALIIDLRDNRGGSAAIGREILSYFVKDSVHWSDTYNRLTDKWTADWTANRPEVTGGIYLGMPITVLTSSWTFSAAEGLAYNLKYGRKARVVGEATAGGAHVLRRVGLGNGFVGFIPYIRGVNVVSKTNWEGTGVIPDVATEAPVALLKAQEAILRERMSTTRDTMAVRALEWAIDDARAAAQVVDVPATTLSAYTGRFEEYTFSLRGNLLYSVNGSRNDKTDVLRPITPVSFKIDRESHVEFVRNAAGIVSSIRLLWNDGWIDTIERAQ